MTEWLFISGSAVNLVQGIKNNFSFYRRLLFIVVSLGVVQCVTASSEPGIETITSAKLQGKPSATNTITSLQSPNIAIQSFTPANEYDKKIKNVISLSFVETTPNYIPGNFSVTIHVNIEYRKTINSTLNTINNQVFTVGYNNADGSKYNAKQYISFNDAQYVKVTFVSIDAPTSPLPSGVDVRDLLVLENQMAVLRYFELAVNTAPASFTGVPGPVPAVPGINSEIGADELQVRWQWPTTSGNNYTQLEWTWLENELALPGGIYNNADGTLNTDLLFRNNATRIDIKSAQGTLGSFNVPLFYQGVGKLYYRIRAVAIKEGGNRSDGQWSVIRTYDFKGHSSTAANENAFNWQVNTSYAEDGKHKSVMEYFDGSLRSRQTVTKDNSTGRTIVAETLYDLQGRPSIQILPAPTINGAIAYMHNLNLFNGQAAGTDPALSFDTRVTGSPLTAIPALQTSNGTAKYYSGNNDSVGYGNNKYIPDAEGFPYTATRYTPDATGRIMAQSGVGAAYQLGSGRETKYYYGKPSQEELDGLFGTEVGFNAHYSKNMVQDANGQMSVSYLDMHGRTIATALAGSTPANLVSLNLTAADYPAQNTSSTVTRNLLDDNSNIIVGNALQSVSSILVPATNVYNFNYRLTSQNLLLLSCNAVSVCYDCLYDLEITVADESGDIAPIVRKFSNVSLQNITDNCTPGKIPFFKDANGTIVGTFTDSYGIVSNSINFSESLAPGSYSIRKTLTISEASLQKYKALYLTKAVCKTKQQLIDSVYNVLAGQSNCGKPGGQPLTCESCKANLGTYITYSTAYLNFPGSPALTPTLDSLIHNNYTTDSARCSSLCSNISQLLPAKRLLMLEDMKPFSGQYAMAYDPNLPPAGTLAIAKPLYYKYDIFSLSGATQNPAFVHPYYLNPLGTNTLPDYYRDQYNSVDASVHTTPQKQVAGSVTRELFGQLFNNNWAEALLPYHPEYNKLVFSEAHLAGSYDWINNFNRVNTYADAVAKGYIPSVAGGSSTGAADADPFYHLAAPHPLINPTYLAVMQYKIRSNYLSRGASYVSMWQLAYGRVKCTQPDVTSCFTLAPLPPYNSLTTEEKDAVWNAFKIFYAAERDNDVNSYLETNATLPGASELGKQYLLRFPVNNAQAAFQFEWDWYPSELNGAPNPNAPSLTNGDAGGTALSRCHSYISSWRQQLLQCDILAQRVDRESIINLITAGMEAVCIKGSDAGNPYGSSNVAPATPASVTDRSFEDVINRVFATYGIPKGNYCNSFVIEFPKPYGKNPKFYNEITSTIDSCNCNAYSLIKSQAGLQNASLTTINSYLLSVYGDTISVALFNALSKCSGSGALSRAGAQSLASAPTPVSLINPVFLPAFLKCGYVYNKPCLSCADLSTLTANFRALSQSFIPAYSDGPVFTGINLTSIQIEKNKAYARFINYRTGYQFDWAKYGQAAKNAGPACNLALINTGATQNVICGDAKPLTDPGSLVIKDSACAHVRDMAIAIGEMIYQTRIDFLAAAFELQYRAKCLGVQNLENFYVTNLNKEYHYTLYYYDQAGSLVKTVPPKGVNPDFSIGFTNSIKAARVNGSYLTTAITRPHTFTTNYRYNSLGQVTAQNTPDAATSLFWYDKLGRLVVSQNAQQAATNKYSYTLYDALGRIIEVGQKPQPAGTMSQTVSQNPVALQMWVMNNTSTAPSNAGGFREQVTFTAYDIANPSLCDANPSLSILCQQNLRNRVSYSMVFDNEQQIVPFVAGNNTMYRGGNAASYYSYDIHGNVDILLQDLTGPMKIATAPVGNTYKMITYNYDLISGKVNQVNYQPNNPKESFYHHYYYDAENRITQVETSRDKIVWERDAAYNYYKHGPLARTELGKLRVQGVDYAYTMQGWLKGTNQTSLSPSLDMGMDGQAGLTNANSAVARDIFSFGLHYYDQTVNGNALIDYKAIGSQGPFARPALPAANFQSLYNGNIAAMSVNNAGLLKAPAAATNALPLMYNYRYDQLNRIVSMQAYKGLDVNNNLWNAVAIQDYKEAISYDPNGNIITYNRKGISLSGKQLEMDALAYDYYAGTNQLKHISDPTPAANYTEDIDNQANAANYVYDKIGNMVSDAAEGISNITWSVYGKILSINKSTGTISYTYDASGNRISKTAGGKTTVHVRDATGNVLSVYESVPSANPLQAELHLYGSSRLGLTTIRSIPTQAVSLASDFAAGGVLSTFTRGEKIFELSNHLGNVLATISDRTVMALPGSEGCAAGTAKNALDIYSRGTEVTYTARQVITFLPGFESSLNDNFTAYIDPSLVECTVADPATPVGMYYRADVVSASDYYPFGMQMVGRKYSFSSLKYRYGFNGKENDNEVKGEGGQQDYGMRIYDTRLGRFLSVDPITKSYPELTPYQFAENSPILYIDLDGLEKALPWYFRENKNGGKPILTLGLGNLPRATRIENYQMQSDAGKVGVFVVNSLSSAWNGIADTWNDGMDGKTGSQMLQESVASIEKLTLNDFKKIETWENVAGGIVTAYAVKRFSVKKGMALAERVNARTNFVKAKYSSAIEKYGLDHIDYTKPLSEVKLSGTGLENKRLVQWREPGNPNASPFFTYDGVDPGTLGIPKTYTQKYFVELPGAQTFLETTANKVKAFSAKDPGVNGSYNGGGTQLYSPEAAKTATFAPAGN